MDPRLLSADRNQPFFQSIEDCCPHGNIRATLQNKELWTKFHELETEMIITKSGRRMFPSLNVQLRGLDPHAHYCVVLEMAPATCCRHKYTVSGGWAPAGAEEVQSSFRRYIHPDSPATGDFWMSQPVSFAKVKLTNTPSPPMGQVVLSSMHKYQPKIIIAKTVDPRTIDWSPRNFIVFEETAFIAVTAYQNDNVTKLKIDSNPFAKGFRETGQSKSKRKRISEEGTDVDGIEAKSQKLLPMQKIEKVLVVKKTVSECSAEKTPSISPVSVESETQPSSVPTTLSQLVSQTYIPTYPTTVSPSLSSASPPIIPMSGIKFVSSSYPIPYSYLRPTALKPMMFLSHYPYCYMPEWNAYPNHCYPLYPPPQHVPKDLRNCELLEKKRTISDHSIRAIIGCD